MDKKSKYNAKKCLVDGIVFDSKAEALFYNLHKDNPNMARQVKFVLIEPFQVGKKKYRAMTYIADFVFYDVSGNMEKVVDVKGLVLPEFRLKAKLFASKFGMSITIAKKVAYKNEFEEKTI